MERELEAVNNDSDSNPDLNSRDKSAKVSQNLIPSSASASGSWEEPGYFSGYLKRMPGQERRKLQKEIQKGHINQVDLHSTLIGLAKTKMAMLTKL